MLKIFVFIEIWFVKEDIQKWLKTKICCFLWRIWKWKEKRTKCFVTFWSRDLNPRFSAIFPSIILIFMWSEEPEINSKQASKRDRTLQTFHESSKTLAQISRARELQRALQTRRGLPRFWHRSSFCDSQLNQVNKIGKSSFISLEFHFKDKNPILLQHN